MPGHLPAGGEGISTYGSCARAAAPGHNFFYPLPVLTFFVEGALYNEVCGPDSEGGEGMRTVYLDELFLLNFVVDYLLLLSAGRLAGEVLRRGRLALGALLGAAYAAAVFLPGWSFLLHPLCKLGAAVGMVLIGYGGSRRLLRVSLVFFAVSAAFGGGIFALNTLGSRGLALENGVLSSAMDLRLILLSAAGCYVLITLVFQRAARHSGPRELVPAVLQLDGRRVALTALVDTGNTLTDPATGRPVMVAEGEKVWALFPVGQAPGPEELRNPAALLERLDRQGWRGRCRLLPYQAVGVECGMLLALRLDGARIGTEDWGRLLLALSPTPLTDGGGYCALIGT